MQERGDYRERINSWYKFKFFFAIWYISFKVREGGVKLLTWIDTGFSIKWAKAILLITISIVHKYSLQFCCYIKDDKSHSDTFYTLLFFLGVSEKKREAEMSNKE